MMMMLLLAGIEGMISGSGTSSPHAEEALSHTSRPFIAINRSSFGRMLLITIDGYSIG